MSLSLLPKKKEGRGGGQEEALRPLLESLEGSRWACSLGQSSEAGIEIGIARVLLAFRHPRKGVASFGIWAVFQPFSGTFLAF